MAAEQDFDEAGLDTGDFYVPGKSYTPTRETFLNKAGAFTPPLEIAPETPLGNAVGLQDIIKMLELNRLMAGVPKK